MGRPAWIQATRVYSTAVDSIGMRRGLIIPGDRSDGLERQGSNPWSTTKFNGLGTRCQRTWHQVDTVCLNFLASCCLSIGQENSTN